MSQLDKSHPSQLTPEPSAQSLVGGAIKRASVLFSGSVFIALLTLVQNILITRALGAEQYGVWGLGVSFAALAFGLLGFRTQDALNRCLAHALNKETGTKALVSGLISSALIADFLAAAVTTIVLLASFSLLIPTLTEHPAALLVFTTNVFALMMTAPDKVFQAVTRHADATHLIPAVNLTAISLRIAVTALLFATSLINLQTLAYSNLAVAFIVGGLQTLLLGRMLHASLDIRWSDLPVRAVFTNWRQRKDFWSMLIVTFFSSSASSIFKQADVLLLGIWRDDQAVGLYRLAKSLALVVQNVGSSLAFSLFSDFNRLVVEKRYDELRSALKHISVLLLGAIPIAAIGILLTPYAVPLIYGHEFESAITPLQIMIISSTIVIVLAWTFPLIVSFRREKLYLYIIVGATAAQTGAALIVLPTTTGVIPMALISMASWAGLYFILAAVNLLHLRVESHKRT